MKRLFLLLALLGAFASPGLSQTLPWNTVTSLPTTCTPATSTSTGSEPLILIASGNSAPFYCSAPNVYSSLVNPMIVVDNIKYKCSSGGINAANLAAIALGGGTVDARTCPSFLGADYTTEIDAGNSGGIPVTLLVPNFGSWGCNITDGVSFCLKVFQNSSIIGSQAGYGAFQIQPYGNFNVAAMCGSDPSAGSNQHIRMEGFNCDLFAGQGTVVNAIGYFKFFGDQSLVQNMTFGNISSTAGVSKIFWVDNACCGASARNIVAEAGALSSAVPCYFGNGATFPNLNIEVDGINCLHPGNTVSALVDNENAQFGNNVFRNIYMEMSTETDTTTAWISVTANSTPVAADVFIGVTAGGDVAASTRYVFDIASGAKATILGLQQGSISTNLINDHNHTTIVAPVNTTIRGYSTEKDYENLLAFIEGTAPSAVTNQDVCYGDSTAHALECSYNNGSFGVVPLINRAQTWTADQVDNTTSTGRKLPVLAAAAPTADGNVAVDSGDHMMYIGSNATTQRVSKTCSLIADSSGSTSVTLGSITWAASCTFPVKASTNYQYECDVQSTSTNAAGGLFMGITGPTTPTQSNYALSQALTATSSGFHNITQTTTYSTTGAGVVAQTITTAWPAHFAGTFENGTTPGTLSFQFASGSASGTTVLKRGSFCTVH